MVPLRHSVTDARHGLRVPRVCDGLRAAVHGEQETLPDTEHLSVVQRLPGYAVTVYVL